MDVDNDPSLKSLVDSKTLKWIFVGGKGGVGKTTTSCCLGIQLSKVRESVLLISTDPAHNLSDAFNQKFTKKPTLVNNFTNLYAMEVDPTLDPEQMPFLSKEGEGSMLADLATSIPGIDEAMSFAEVMRLVQSMEFSVIVFDTAPTGHTLRLLSFPSVLQKSLEKLVGLKSRFSGLFTQVAGMFGVSQEISENQLEDRLTQTQAVINEVNTQFKNPDLTTFVCVCIPEFLSLYETERLVIELNRYSMDTHNVVINQVLYPQGDCALCNARSIMQQKYIDQIEELYEDFHVVKMPLLKEEVRGTDALASFSQYLVTPFNKNDK